MVNIVAYREAVYGDVVGGVDHRLGRRIVGDWQGTWAIGCIVSVVSRSATRSRRLIHADTASVGRRRDVVHRSHTAATGVGES